MVNQVIIAHIFFLPQMHFRFYFFVLIISLLCCQNLFQQVNKKKSFVLYSKLAIRVTCKLECITICWHRWKKIPTFQLIPIYKEKLWLSLFYQLISSSWCASPTELVTRGTSYWDKERQIILIWRQSPLMLATVKWEEGLSTVATAFTALHRK